MASFKVESWIWYSVTILMVLARMVARLLHFKSFLRLQIEDFLMLFLTCLYTILIVFLNIVLQVSTNLIDPAVPVTLTPHEIHERVWGSKTILLVEQCMCAVQWGTKVCLLLLYWRLTKNLTQHLVVKGAFIYVGVTFVVMEICYFAVWCRPFRQYWAVPTNNQQCSTALHHLIMNLSFNVTSDILIMSIPLPLLLKTHLEFKRKVLLVLPFSLGLFTILCAILSKHLSFTQPYSSEWVFWYCREASTAMIVTNMPYSWALIRRIFHVRSFLGDATVNEMHGGQDRELEGYGVSTETGSLTRQPSHAGASTRKLSWNYLMPPKRSASAIESPTEPPPPSRTWTSATPKEKEGAVDVGAASSSNSTADSVQKHSHVPAPATDRTLDKLYPLDDDDDGNDENDLSDTTRRRYEP